VKTLPDAIAAAEQAAGNLTGADGNQAAAQQKFDQAQAAKAQADAQDAAAVASYNSALTELIAAAQAAMIDRTPAPVPAPAPTV
jgi:hypothetical protein